ERTTPPPHLGTLENGDEQKRDGNREKACAQQIEFVFVPWLVFAQKNCEQDRSSNSEWHREVEHVAPGQRIRDQPSDRWPNETGEAPDAGEHALHAPALLQREDVTNDGDRNGHHGACAE